MTAKTSKLELTFVKCILTNKLVVKILKYIQIFYVSLDKYINQIRLITVFFAL